MQSRLVTRSPLRYNETVIGKGGGGVADMETICARLCLLTRAAWRADLPAPLTRPTVHKMLRCGAISGLALREVSGINKAHYARAEALLTRSAAIAARVEAWRARGYAVVLPEDEDWPVNLHALGIHMPQFLVTLGDRALFARRAVAVAGSRSIAPETERLAQSCGASLARAGYAMACGGAVGVDTAAQRGFLKANGSLMLVPAMPVDVLLRQHVLLRAMQEGRLLLVCDTWPDEVFSPEKALSRNRTIYALGDAAVVVAARHGVGGTWSGASFCLRGGYTPVYAFDAPGADFEGNRALLARGAARLDARRPVAEQLFAAKEETT